MSDTAPDKPEADFIFPAGYLSRVGKFPMGLMQMQAVYVFATTPALAVLDAPVSDVLYYVVVGLAVILLPWTINLGFRKQWGRRPLYVFAVLLAIGAGISMLTQGSIWGPPVAFLLYAVSLYVHAHMGFSHVLAAILGTPGCEMRAIPHVLSKLGLRNADFCPCPGFWTPLDRWEYSLRNATGGHA